MKNKLFPLLPVILFFTLITGLFRCKSNDLLFCPGDDPAYHTDQLGRNVFIFEPGMDMNKIQALLDTIYKRQAGRESEFNTNRIALLFKPGAYELDVKVGYYMHVIGLGDSPDDVVITGAVRSKSRSQRKHVLTNFWRAAENLTVIPTIEPANVWGVSQAAPFRRIHVKGDLQLHDEGYASGGFMADCMVDGTVLAGQQQQWFTRNSQIGGWSGGQWNIMFMGVQGAPPANWPDGPVTSFEGTPVVKEKPYLVIQDGELCLRIPGIMENSSGTDWQEEPAGERTMPLSTFFIVKEGCTAAELNRELREGKNIFFTPGVYRFEEPIMVGTTGTIITGIGMPSLESMNGNPVMEVSDVNNISVSALLFDAGEKPAETLLRVGENGCKAVHSDEPVFLADLFFRVGGALSGSASSCMIINSSDVIIDHTWLWRADHGAGVGWEKNTCPTGLIVNGDRVTVYGLFNEHFQEYQTVWNGSNGKTFFYQSELPYDPPSTEAWSHGSTKGYASYKVSDSVSSHEAWGLGVYAYLRDAAVITDNAIEVPASLEKNIHHTVIFWLNGNEDSRINSTINGKGKAVSKDNKKEVL